MFITSVLSDSSDPDKHELQSRNDIVKNADRFVQSRVTIVGLYDSRNSSRGTSCLFSLEDFSLVAKIARVYWKVRRSRGVSFVTGYRDKCLTIYNVYVRNDVSTVIYAGTVENTTNNRTVVYIFLENLAFSRYVLYV